jgi:hypothetical protein
MKDAVRSGRLPLISLKLIACMATVNQILKFISATLRPRLEVVDC